MKCKCISILHHHSSCKHVPTSSPAGPDVLTDFHHHTAEEYMKGWTFANITEVFICLDARVGGEGEGFACRMCNGGSYHTNFIFITPLGKSCVTRQWRQRLKYHRQLRNQAKKNKKNNMINCFLLFSAVGGLRNPSCRHMRRVSRSPNPSLAKSEGWSDLFVSLSWGLQVAIIWSRSLVDWMQKNGKS